MISSLNVNSRSLCRTHWMCNDCQDVAFKRRTSTLAKRGTIFFFFKCTIPTQCIKQKALISTFYTRMNFDICFKILRSKESKSANLKFDRIHFKETAQRSAVMHWKHETFIYDALSIKTVSKGKLDVGCLLFVAVKGLYIASLHGWCWASIIQSVGANSLPLFFPKKLCLKVFFFIPSW